jgi:phosphoglycerate dehydrogenase-like enzyme
VCIVGLGSIGEQLVERLRPFGVKIVATDEHPEHAPADVTAYSADQMNIAVAHADFVVICVRASKENENLINASVLGAMKRGAVLVNIARGTLIDEVALVAAVKDGQISAAGLDVLKSEPLDPNNLLLKLPQVLVTPHIAGSTDLMLNGTANYVSVVIKEFAAGKKSKSILNSPELSLAKLKICCGIRQLFCGTIPVDGRVKLVSWYACSASCWFYPPNSFVLAAIWFWRTWHSGNNLAS